MSLDVFLTLEGEKTARYAGPGSGIFVRENGQTKEISLEEWNAKHPGQEPVVLRGMPEEDGRVYSANITHNITEMANRAGLYMALWRPEEMGYTEAYQLIEPLEEGLKRLLRDPDYFRKFNAANGWGTYEVLVEFVENYLAVCKEFPGALVEVSR